MSVNLIDNYQRQIHILNALRSESQAARGRFEAARANHQQHLRQAEQLGYMGDYVEQLQQRYREFSDKLDHILQTLIRGELRIDDQEQRLRGLIADAMRPE